MVTSILTCSNMNINMKSPTTSEYLSKDILDKDFMKVFFIPLLIQKILGSCRIDARDHFVTAPTVPQKLYTILFKLVSTCISYITLYMYLEPLAPYPRLRYLTVVAITINVVFSLCNGIHVRFMNRCENVMFYIKLQEIDRMMDIIHCQPINTMLSQVHNFTLIFFGAMILLLFVLTLLNSTVFFYLFISLVMSYGAIIFEISYFSNFVVYFYLRIRFINAIMDNHIHDQQIKLYTNSKFCKSTSWNLNSIVASHSHYFVTSNTDDFLKSIFECFVKFQDLYSFQVNFGYKFTIYKK